MYVYGKKRPMYMGKRDQCIWEKETYVYEEKRTL